MIYIGECPFDDQGMLGVWRCADGESLVVMCDECYGIWRSPEKISDSNLVLSADRNNVLPGSSVQIFGGRSGWASREEVERAGWSEFIKDVTPVRVARIYIRTNGIYVIPHGHSIRGRPVPTPPFEFLPSNAELPILWEAIQMCLANANRIVSDEMAPWCFHAGVKSWGEFASKAKGLNIADNGNELVFVVLCWDGRDLHGVPDLKKILLKSAELSEKLSTLGEFLGKAKELQTNL